MKKHYTIIIAGAGGIAEAVALLLAEWSMVTPTIFIGNRTLSKAKKIAKWIEDGTSKPCSINTFHLSENEITNEMKEIFHQGAIILDCLPGHLAPKMAQFAKDFQMHYANLTEYVAETEQIKALAKNAETGFVLQTGLAPGYINVLANGLFQQFCTDFEVTKVNKLELKVGALTKHAIKPHYYGFTWSPIGVATEYIKDTVVLQNFKKTIAPSLSERATILINGISYEDDLTSGGVADLPDALLGKVHTLNYKTLRYPGHYQWVQEQLSNLGNTPNAINYLQQKMEAIIPHIEDDQIVLYAAVEGKDKLGKLCRREVYKHIFPQKIGKYTLRAIQTTTAVPLIQSAKLLLENNLKGVILQSQIDAKLFLNGKFIIPVYGII
tara:strand:+ start:1334 stop:2476 length:1143 start_codon:yes stop_codon:yes gene_type:complete